MSNKCATYPATARRCRALLHISLSEAMKLGMVTINPVARTTPPKHTPRAGQSWSADEARSFLTVAAGDGYAPYWHIALYLGMRPSEIEGLRWESLDLTTGTLTVERARPTAMGRVFASETTKSGAGTRTVHCLRACWPHSAPIVRISKSSKTRPATRGTITGWSVVAQPARPSTTPTYYGTSKVYAKGPRCRRFASMTRATALMLDAGGDLKAVSEVAGHSNPGITMRVYRHVKQDHRTAALHGLANTLDSPALDAPN